MQGATDQIPKKDEKTPTSDATQKDHLFKPWQERDGLQEAANFESHEDYSRFEVYVLGEKDASTDKFGQLPAQVAELLEKRGVAVVCGNCTQLQNLASTVLAEFYPKPSSHWIFWSKPQTTFRKSELGIPDAGMPIPIVELIREEFLSSRDQTDGRTVLIVHDLYDPSFTTLEPYAYLDPAARVLFLELKNRPHLRVLVLTLEQTWTRLIQCDGTPEFASVGLSVCSPDEDNPRPAPKTIAEILDATYTRFHEPGIWTAWCAVWMTTASMDGVVFCIEAMIAQWQPKEEKRNQAVKRWRWQWNSVIDLIKAGHAEDRGMVRIQFQNEEWASELRRQLRTRYRMQHIEALNLLRVSEVLREAPADLLEAMALFFSRLAREDAQPGKAILVHLVEHWLGNTPRDRCDFLLAEVFFNMVRDGETAFASDALTQLIGSGYDSAVFEILRRCPPRLLNQDWNLLLYNRVLPQLDPEYCVFLWSRMIQLGAAPQGPICTTIELASKNLSGHLQVQFVARFVEELLLGDRSRRTRLLEILNEAVTDSAVAGKWLFSILRSDDFRDFAKSRAKLWSLDPLDSPFFSNWLLVTVLPIVPSISPLALEPMLARVLTGDAIWTGNGPNALDVFITMLLVDYSFGDSPDYAWNKTLTEVAGLAIRDKESAAACHAILQDLSDRFLSASRDLERLSPTETVLNLQTADAIRHFFDQKSEITYRLSKVVEDRFFTE